MDLLEEVFETILDKEKIKRSIPVYKVLINGGDFIKIPETDTAYGFKTNDSDFSEARLCKIFSNVREQESDSPYMVYCYSNYR